MRCCNTFPVDEKWIQEEMQTHKITRSISNDSNNLCVAHHYPNYSGYSMSQVKSFTSSVHKSSDLFLTDLRIKKLQTPSNVNTETKTESWNQSIYNHQEDSCDQWLQNQMQQNRKYSFETLFSWQMKSIKLNFNRLSANIDHYE